MNTSRCKVKGSITICTAVVSAKNKGYEGWTPNYKLALLNLVETDRKIFSKDIMREQLLKIKNMRQISTKILEAMLNDVTVN